MIEGEIWMSVYRVGKKKNYQFLSNSPPIYRSLSHNKPSTLVKVKKRTYTDVMSKLLGGKPVTISVAPRIVPIPNERGDKKNEMIH